MPFPWISLRRSAQANTTKHLSPPPGISLHTLPSPPRSRISADNATSSLSTSTIIHTRGTEAVQAWLETQDPDALASLRAEQVSVVHGPQTHGSREVKQWLAAPGPETLDGVLSARDRARTEALARGPTLLARPAPALPALRFETLGAMLRGTGLEEVEDEEGAGRESAAVGTPETRIQEAEGSSMGYLDGISYIDPDLLGSSPETSSTSHSARSRIAGLHREPVYSFPDDELSEGNDDGLFIYTARSIKEGSDGGDGEGEHPQRQPTSGLGFNEEGDEDNNSVCGQVLPLASAIVRRAREVEIPLRVPTLHRRPATIGRHLRVPRLVREDANLGDDLAMTVERASRGYVVDAASPVLGSHVVDDNSYEGETETDERARSRGRHDWDTARAGSWRSEEDELAEVMIKVTPATPERESVWDSASSSSSSDDDSEWIEDIASPSDRHVGDGSRDTTDGKRKTRPLTIRPPLHTARHGRHLEIPLETYGPSQHTTTAISPPPTPILSTAPIFPPVPPPPLSSTQAQITFLNRTLSLPETTPFHILQAHLAENTSLLHALFLGLVPAPHLPSTETNDPVTGTTTRRNTFIRLSPDRRTTMSIPAMSAFLALKWDPAATGGGPLAFLSTGFRVSLADADGSRAVLENAVAHLRKRTGAQMRRQGHLRDALLVRLGRVVELREVAACPDLKAVVRAGRAEEFVRLVEEGRISRGSGGEMRVEGAVLDLMGIGREEGSAARVERRRREGGRPSPLRVVEVVGDE
ncbi:hypothetical protein ACHAQA_004076 [Verticillium albo-atrum]